MLETVKSHQTLRHSMHSGHYRRLPTIKASVNLISLLILIGGGHRDTDAWWKKNKKDKK